MVKITQNVEAAYEVESVYGSPPGSNLFHLGLLDTFDPRQVERSVTPVPSIGQSTDAHHALGPLGVTVPPPSVKLVPPIALPNNACHPVP